jgi:hypothetical protein
LMRREWSLVRRPHVMALSKRGRDRRRHAAGGWDWRRIPRTAAGAADGPPLPDRPADG